MVDEAKRPFEEGDVVFTKENENDLELIPAGTSVKLLSLKGDNLWYGTADFSGGTRPVLVYENNLRQAFC